MMNKQQILRKIGDIIQELKEQHQYLTNAKKISLLELELFTANSDFLIDHIEILKKLDLNVDLEQKLIEQTPEIKKIEEHREDEKPVIILEEHSQTNEEQVFEDEEISQPKKRIFDFSFDEQPTEMIFDFEKKIEVADVFDRNLSEEEEKFLANKSKELKDVTDVEEEDFDDVEEEIGEEPFLVVKPEENHIEAIEELEPIIEEKVEVKLVKDSTPTIIENSEKQEKRLTLNEMLSAKLGKNSGSNSGSKQITDLKTSISLNDKMVFIKELFNGYNLAYSEAIEIINRFETFDAADNFLQKNYSVKNDWTLKQSTVDRLYEYLNKKFVS
ncbi:hypothetical protein A5893_03255 [Pedobacter psychrophilus]|uniref:Uncharacterized protein n=1 Tax=Pedobacter psychrophilus TaxID=1826909 RepID=A0A179DM66_9SPHI|nr:hypothetical protein [Pedobacter psychrophilus]OAQ42147.1 hypothetical protein A5893_03255 [Pedobacter psychrophilus]